MGKMTSFKAVGIVTILTGFFCFLCLAGAEVLPSPKITILKAEYNAPEGKPVVEVEGETDLPDGASLSVFIRKGSELTAYKEIKTASGRFSAKLGPLGKELDGEYSVQVVSAPDSSLKTIQAVSLFKAAATGNEISPYGIEIWAYNEQYGKQVIVHADGKTSLPDGAVLKVYMKRIDTVIVFGECVVAGGMFSISFGPFGKELAPGAYTVEAEFFPDMQRPEFRKTAANQKIPASKNSCEAVIGKAPEASKAENTARQEVNSAVTALDELYWELKDVYALSQTHFDPATWDEWSDRWRFHLKKVSNSLKDGSGRDKSLLLYPESEKGLPLAVKYLTEIYVIMTDTLKNRIPAKKGELEKRCYALENELVKLMEKMKAELANSPKV